MHSEVTMEQSKTKCSWFDAQNIEINKTGSIIKMLGNIELGQLTGQKILGIQDYYHKSGTHFCLVNASEGKLYNFDTGSGVFTELHSGFSLIERCTYVNAFDGCIVNDGVNDPVFYEYNVTPAISQCNTPSTHRGKPLCLHKGRLFVKTLSGLGYSALGKYNDWTTANDAGVIEDIWNDYSEVTALKSYGEYLAIHKKSGNVYLLTGNSPETFEVTPFGDKAAVSQFAVNNALNMQLYYSENASIYPLTHNSLGQIKLDDEISLMISKDFSNIDTSKLTDITILEHPIKNQVWFFMPYQNTDDLSVCWILHKIDKKNIAWMKRVALPVTCATVVDNIILTGTSDGKILQEDFGATLNGAPLPAFWDSPWFHFGMPEFLKSADKLFFSCSGERLNKFKYFFRKNYDRNKVTNTKEIIINNTNVLDYDSGEEYDSGLVYADNIPLRTKKKKIPGKFLSLQLHIELTELDDDIALLGLVFTDIISEE